MSHRVYVVMGIIAGKSGGQIVQTLRSKPGVILADETEDQPRIIMVVQTAGQQELAKLTIRAIDSVESMTDGIQILIVKDECCACPSSERALPGTEKSGRK